jgi:hypothetical protein
VVKIKLKAISFFVIVAMILLSCSGKPSPEHILFDFESDSELDRLNWKCRTLFSLSKEHVTHGAYSLKMETFPSMYPGFSPKLDVMDWSHHKQLTFDIFNNSDTTVNVVVRIDDKKESSGYADRYNQVFPLRAGTNTIVIPFDKLVTSGNSRFLKLKRIHRFLIFLNQPEKHSIFYMDYVRIS